jgi:hypothetical protein
MPNNYILLETIALTQSAASVTFDNLPTSGYTDLKIVFSTRDNNAQPQNGIFVSINGSTANFTNRYLLGSGSAASSGSIARFLGYSPGAGATANTFSNGELYFPNYRSSNNKSFSSDNVQETNASTAYMVMSAHLWSQTAAITSISLIADSASFVAGSTFSLYGIAALGTTPVLAPKATGGNRIENDGTYWIHTFLTSGTFTPQVGLNCDVLVVAGGGGGGDRVGGGGGAGGFRTATGQSLTIQNYPVTVGAGGAGGNNPSVGTPGVAGNDSVLGSITSTGGGRGGCFGTANRPTTGGSGGGAGAGDANNTLQAGAAGNTPSTSPSQGNSGGSGNNNANVAVPYGYVGGGGGGSASAGTGGVVSSGGGTGGSGTSNSYSGSSVTYAAGGNGCPSYNNPSETQGATGGANTGNGGGGSGGGTYSGGAGGSGIVIIRYPIA